MCLSEKVQENVCVCVRVCMCLREKEQECVCVFVRENGKER